VADDRDGQAATEGGTVAGRAEGIGRRGVFNRQRAVERVGRFAVGRGAREAESEGNFGTRRRPPVRSPVRRHSVVRLLPNHIRIKPVWLIIIWVIIIPIVVVGRIAKPPPLPVRLTFVRCRWLPAHTFAVGIAARQGSVAAVRALGYLGALCGVSRS